MSGKNLPALATDETAHVKCCLYAGIKVSGTNAEVSTVQSTVHAVQYIHYIFCDTVYALQFTIYMFIFMFKIFSEMYICT